MPYCSKAKYAPSSENPIMLISALSAAIAGSDSATIASRLATSRPKAARTTLRCIELLLLGKTHRAHRRHHHLRNPVAAPDLERIAAVVDEDHLHLAAI